MHHALAELRLPGGFTPAINSAVYAQDWPAFLAAANGFFKDPVLQWHLNQGYHRNHIPLQKGGPGWGNTILNDLCTPKVKGLQAKPLRTSSRLFPDAGVAVLRDGWGDDASVLVLDFGHPEGGHAYAGQASFTAWIKGRPAVFSPGSPFAYSDPEYQPWYYSTQGQNTVWIDGEDQETWRPGRKRRIWGRLLDWEEDRDRTRVRVSHDGYLASKGVRHERTVLFQKGRYFLVYDVLDGTRSEAERVLRWTIRCPDELTEKENRVVQSAGEVGLRMVPAWAESIQDVEIGWGPSMVPVTYQEDMTVQKAQVCHARLVQTLAAGETARYLVVMTAGDCGNTAVRAEVVGGKVEAEVTVDGQVDRVVLA